MSDQYAIIRGVTRGSDVRLIVTISDGGSPLNLAGRSVVPFEVSEPLINRVSAEITDAVAGQVTILIEGTDPIPLGRHSFRLQVNAPITGGADSLGLPRFILEVI